MTEEDQKTEAIQKIMDKHREQGNLVTMYEREISHLKHQLSFCKAREERLWQTLMAMSAIMRGSPRPPTPEMAESYYIAFIEDAQYLYDYKTKPWWKRIFK